MHWSELVIYAAGGAVGGGLGALLAGKFPERKWLLPLTVVLSFVLFKIAFLSWTETKKADDTAEQALQSVGVYRAIKADDPAFYAELKQRFANGLREGKSRQSMVDDIAVHLMSRFQRYAHVTSNKAAVRMARAIVATFESLDGDTCYAMMFPAQNAGKVNTLSTVTATAKNEMAAAVEEMIESAIRNPQPPPNKDETQPALETALRSLSSETLQDLQLVNHVLNAAEEKARACNASRTMFQKILEQPESEAGPLLRFLMGS